jgi:hypothetical protein
MRDNCISSAVLQAIKGVLNHLDPTASRGEKNLKLSAFSTKCHNINSGVLYQTHSFFERIRRNDYRRVASGFVIGAKL